MNVDEMFQGINGAIRDETLLQLSVPVMFVQVMLSIFVKDLLIRRLPSKELKFWKYWEKLQR